MPSYFHPITANNEWLRFETTRRNLVRRSHRIDVNDMQCSNTTSLAATRRTTGHLEKLTTLES